MPWEKSFDESEVIELAMRVFWAKGYAATSISDITKATGIKRGSLYNAFEGKDDLFMRGLLKYDIDRRRKWLQELDGIDDPREAITKLFDRVVQHSINDEEKRVLAGQYCAEVPTAQ